MMNVFAEGGVGSRSNPNGGGRITIGGKGGRTRRGRTGATGRTPWSRTRNTVYPG